MASRTEAVRVTKSELSRTRMIASAGESFRRAGYGGIGVDGLAKAAGLTSGAFYFHFRSKLGAFVESVQAGLVDLRRGIGEIQVRHKRRWLAEFVAFYMGYKRTCEMGESCTLPLLTPEVERAGPEAHAAYQEQLLETRNTVSRGLRGSKGLSADEQSWAVLALLSGGVAMARAVEDPALSKEIAAAVAKAAKLIAVAKSVDLHQRAS